MSKKEINVNGLIIRTSKVDKEHYISLTDLAKSRKARPKDTISNWMRNRDTLSFLELWEKLNNENFKGVETDAFKGFKTIQEEYFALGNRFVISPAKWLGYTNGIGFTIERGRYGGIWAHEDIAIEFASWLSSAFKLYVITEFKRLKLEEQKRLGDPFNIKRLLTSGNFSFMINALTPKIDERAMTHPQPYKSRLWYASEADMLNKIVFGFTAKDWKKKNTDKPVGRNMRDYATVLELTILNNLEFYNALLLNYDCEKDERERLLKEAYDLQYVFFSKSKTIKKMQELANQQDK